MNFDEKLRNLEQILTTKLVPQIARGIPKEEHWTSQHIEAHQEETYSFTCVFRIIHSWYHFVVDVSNPNQDSSLGLIVLMMNPDSDSKR
jgi:hypothetical protein